MKDNEEVFLRSLAAVEDDDGRESCSVHGPLLIYALEGGAYVVLCFTCGAIGPERWDGWEAKLAFDDLFRSAD